MASQQSAQKLVRELFQTEYDDASADGRQALAQKLLEQARKSDDLAERFVLLRESGDVAAMGGKLSDADLAIDHVVANFETDGLDLRLKAYQILVKAAAPDKALGEQCIAAADSAVNSDHLEAAEQFMQLAETAVQRHADPKLSRAIALERDRLRSRVTELAQVTAAENKLKIDPKDSVALSTLGFHWCFVKGDWTKGLPMLARSSDQKLQLLAQAELSKPSDANAQFELANGWWAVREQYPVPARAAIVSHAASWYASAVPHLSGLKRAVADKRSSGVEATPPVTPAEAREPSPKTEEPKDVAKEKPRDASVVYVCDASGSMMGLPFDLVKIQLKHAINDLRPEQRFNVIFFQKGSAIAASKTLLTATEANKQLAREMIENVRVASNSDPLSSLELALGEHPVAAYLLTDGAFDDGDAVLQKLRRLNKGKGTRLNTIAFFTPNAPESERQQCEDCLRAIAKENGGTFRVVLTSELTQ